MTRISTALHGLFQTYPSFATDDLDATLRVYFEAVSAYEDTDILAGVHDFITGSVPGHNPAFAPSAPQVGSAVRRAMERRLDSERRSRIARPRLPPPDIAKAPEQRARVKAKVDDLLEKLSAQIRTDEAATTSLRNDLVQRTNATFAPSFDPAEMRRRLWEIGDSDADGDMGGVP